ncbi:hypothetical protein CWE12_01320 [Aliidiomarina sedimenti]|uniref:DUF3080 domain-containing protein n=1 Tax=Aliidiomarina sedimenti TaxID=1933879 RepID=A0ABY0C1C5_9GAMM|nr:DUF3080 family protein [Aliidiomarina sedimenti]RUO31665.1 hypothetical protein CWE12_01320 [Aliidiomarina sedimenti]
MQQPQSVKLTTSVLSLARLGKSIVIASLLMLVACSGGSDSERLWQRYHQALSDSLSEQPVPVQPTPLPVMPRSDALRLEIERFSVGLLDTLRLDHCRLSQLIAQRNSALGIAQSPQARLRYELDSLKAIDECLQNAQSAVDNDPRIHSMLTDARAHKVQTLPLYIDQLLTRGDSFRQALRAHSAGHASDDSSDLEAALAALQYLQQLFTQAVAGHFGQLDLEPYNQHLRTLAQSDALPRQWRTMHQTEAWLRAINQQLAGAAEQLECTSTSASGSPAQSQRLQTLMQTVYLAQVEPRLTRWNADQQLITSQLNKLSAFSVQPEWQQYINQLIGSDSHAEQVRALTVEHSRLWQQLRAQCQLTTDPLDS